MSLWLEPLTELIASLHDAGLIAKSQKKNQPKWSCSLMKVIFCSWHTSICLYVSHLGFRTFSRLLWLSDSKLQSHSDLHVACHGKLLWSQQLPQPPRPTVTHTHYFFSSIEVLITTWYKAIYHRNQKNINQNGPKRKNSDWFWLCALATHD